MLWDHHCICSPSLTETLLCGAYLYSERYWQHCGQMRRRRRRWRWRDEEKRLENEGEEMGEEAGRTLCVSCSTGSVVKSVWLVTLLTVVSFINHNTCTQQFRTHQDTANIKWGLTLSNWNTIATMNADMQLHVGFWWETSHNVDNKGKCKHNGLGQ
jgi:hypothetical protein